MFYPAMLGPAQNLGMGASARMLHQTNVPRDTHQGDD